MEQNKKEITAFIFYLQKSNPVFFALFESLNLYVTFIIFSGAFCGLSLQLCSSLEVLSKTVSSVTIFAHYSQLFLSGNFLYDNQQDNWICHCYLQRQVEGN